MSSTSFAMSVAPGAAPAVITLRGAINEDSVLEVGEVPPGAPVVVDVGGVTAINSLGVRHWIDFLRDLSARASEVRLRRMTPVLVQQAATITSFLGSAIVESYSSPWTCPRCGNVHDELHTYPQPPPDTLPCPKCKTPMEFDDLLDAYASFLAAAR